MTVTLPADITARAANEADLSAIVDMVNTCLRAAGRRADTVPGHIQDFWEDTNLALDSVMLVTSAGEIVGYSSVSPDSEWIRLDAHTCVHPAYRHLGLEKALLALVEERARRLLAEAVLPIPAKMRAWAFYAVQREMLTRAGYQITSSELNLEIDLREQPPMPQALPGISVRPYQPGHDEHAVHAVIQEAFQDIGGRPYRPFDEWVKGVMNHRFFDPEQLFVALDQGQVVGAINCRTYDDEPGEIEGHITQLGVLRPWRKRGIARHLMQRVFATYYQRNIRHITISVDAHNATGAIQLYQGLGMQEYEQVDNLLKVL